MGARDNRMAWFSQNVICIMVLIGAAKTQECSIKVAESACVNRTEQYSQVLADPKNNLKFKELCLTQIQKDATAVYFEDALKLCTNSEVDVLQQRWVDLNRNITQLCEQDCPNLRTLPICKNMTFLQEIEFSKYEKFCETFQKSYTCASDNLADCKFGIALYGDIVEPKVISYWTYICNSGCSNIDETVAVITKCLDPLKNADKSTICMAHYTFKQCMQQSKILCKEVLKLVKFVYRKYDNVDKYCTTTTTVTTTPLPETTQPLTETTQPLTETTQQPLTETTQPLTETTQPLTETTQPLTEPTQLSTETLEPSTEIYEVTESSTVKASTVTETSTMVKSRSTESPDERETIAIDIVNVQIEDCLSEEDLEIVRAEEIDVNSVVVYLKLEACLHNTSKDAHVIERIRASFSDSIKKFHSRIKSEAWRIARQTLREKSNCKERKKEISNGCSGHGYGLIPCNSVRVQTSNLLLTSLSIALSMMFLQMVK